MHFAKMNFNGDPNLGLFSFATDSYCIGPTIPRLKKKEYKKIKRILRVPIYNFSIVGTEFLGLFACGNSSGIIVPKIIKEDELTKMEKIFDVLVLETHLAIGNLVLMNDSGIIISPLLKNEKEKIEKFFGIPCVATTIANLNIVGSIGVATNKGCLVHPKIRKREMELIEKILQTPCDIGTVNFGSPFLGSGIIANSFGFIASESTTGFELGRISEALGFL